MRLRGCLGHRVEKIGVVRSRVVNSTPSLVQGVCDPRINIMSH